MKNYLSRSLRQERERIEEQNDKSGKGVMEKSFKRPSDVGIRRLNEACPIMFDN